MRKHIKYSSESIEFTTRGPYTRIWHFHVKFNTKLNTTFNTIVIQQCHQQLMKNAKASNEEHKYFCYSHDQQRSIHLTYNNERQNQWHHIVLFAAAAHRSIKIDRLLVVVVDRKLECRGGAIRERKSNKCWWETQRRVRRKWTVHHISALICESLADLETYGTNEWRMKSSNINQLNISSLHNTT